MLQITRFSIDNPEKPVFSWTAESSQNGCRIVEAVISMNGWSKDALEQTAVYYDGPDLLAFTKYDAVLTVKSSDGDAAKSKISFETGKMKTPWTGIWITDGSYRFTDKKVSPKPMVFRKSFTAAKRIASARIYGTAMGIYELFVNGMKVGDQYLAPGFTSYKSFLQYQTYDVTEMLTDNNEILVHVAGGWAVGSFVFTRVNRVTAVRQAILMEIHLIYEDGSCEVIGTDESWEVAEDGPYKMADLYDGETYDATVDMGTLNWEKAARESLKIRPEILYEYGEPVKRHEELKPVKVTRAPDGDEIYDFGQNFAGVICLKIKHAKAGQKIVVRHAELLNTDGSLNVKFLRTAKATATYICKDGEQIYTPTMTYMGFRYAGISGITASDVEVSAFALYSDVRETGSFECSNEMLNRLQSNILWSSRSNFVDIPTDCPQRDERMGWTGDIAVFSPTACFNFDMGKFLKKWLKDVKAEQLPTGGIPNTVPVQGYGFPATMPKMAIDWWGDACVLVPWNEYMARGDVSVLKDMYPTMKKYVNACSRWARLFSIGQNRYIWSTPSVLHFGDWVAPDVPEMSQWQARSKWTATASIRNTSSIVAKVAKILGCNEEETYYRKLSENTAKAYEAVFTDRNGKLNEEFQTGYVLPIYMDMFETKEAKEKAVENLENLVKKNNYCIGTGFPGTPYILFALADNGKADTAYKMLLNTQCPSWLYEVKSGATTIWERWDGLDENGVCPIGDDGTDIMISYNHYASGAVGAFLYQRVAGIEPIQPGYKKFRIRPVVGGDLSFAKATVDTYYGKIVSDWKADGGKFDINVQVPLSSSCELTLPDGTKKHLEAGNYSFTCSMKQRSAIRK